MVKSLRKKLFTMRSRRGQRCKNTSAATEKSATDTEEQVPLSETECAVFDAGLSMKQLCDEERSSFHHLLQDKDGHDEYLRIRNGIIRQWWENSKSSLHLESCVTAVGGKAETVKEVFNFLQIHGYVNCGIVSSFGSPVAQLLGPKQLDKELLYYELHQILLTADFQVMTERLIRKQLEEKLGYDVSEQKKEVRSYVQNFLGGKINSAPTAPVKSCQGESVEVVVIGAGAAGLAAARHLKSIGVPKVVVLEARDRLGGRVHTEKDSLSVPVDLGASIITGVSPCRRPVEEEEDGGREGLRSDPAALICRQLGLEMVPLKDTLPLLDANSSGAQVEPDVDSAVEKLRDHLLDQVAKRMEERKASGESEDMSLGEALEVALAEWERKAEEEEDGKEKERGEEEVEEAGGLKRGVPLGDLERKLLHWHWAHLEYGCAAPLHQVSLSEWNQDEEFGGFGGPHCMVKGGLSQVVVALAEGLDVRLSSPVLGVQYPGATDCEGTSPEAEAGVRVTLQSGEVIHCAALVVTAPLNTLQGGESIKFSPALPQWKTEALTRLGQGNLAKVLLEFPSVFWDDSQDYFGVPQPSDPAARGASYLFWNLNPVCQAPVLAALYAGQAANQCEARPESEVVEEVLATLRAAYPGKDVPPPVRSCVTRWGADPWARGAYSHVAVGGTGGDYDTLAQPVGTRGQVVFGGEHTCREHPDTVGGAMISGHKAALQVIKVLKEVWESQRQKAALPTTQTPGASTLESATAAGEVPQAVTPQEAIPAEEKKTPPAPPAPSDLNNSQPKPKSEKVPASDSKPKTKRKAVVEDDEDEDEDDSTAAPASQPLKKRSKQRGAVAVSSDEDEEDGKEDGKESKEEEEEEEGSQGEGVEQKKGKAKRKAAVVDSEDEDEDGDEHAGKKEGKEGKRKKGSEEEEEGEDEGGEDVGVDGAAKKKAVQGEEEEEDAKEEAEEEDEENDDDEEEGEEEGEEEEPARGYRDEVMETEEDLARARAREDIKTVLRSLNDLKDSHSGNCSISTLLKLMRQYETDNARTLLFQHMLKCTPTELQRHAEERDLLVRIKGWLEESQHVGSLTALLRLLLRIPVRSVAVCQAAGLPDAIRLHCSKHEQKLVQDLAQQVGKKWISVAAARRTQEKQSSSKVVGKSPAAAGGAGGGGGGGADRGGGGGAASEVEAGGAGGPVEGGPDGEMAEPSGRGPLCQEEAEAYEVARSAFQAAEAAAAAAAEVSQLPQFQLPDFESYTKYMKSQLPGGKGATPGKGSSSKSKRASGGGSASKDPRISHLDSSSKPTSQLAHEVNAYIKQLIQPLLTVKKLTKENAKWILKKASNKVMESTKPEDRNEPTEKFLTSKRKEKIRDLVDKYVKNVLNDKKNQITK